jgi:ATP-dependent RNA circularization protein (DNA/RNA ligase family)
MAGFFRFPHTPHLAWLGNGAPREDKVLSESEVRELLAGEVVVEEKIDGANLGFSLGADGRLRGQNRGQYLIEPYGGQFKRLSPWLALHADVIASALSAGHLMLFGEWCAAQHSIRYTRLPDWFVVFDVYDRTQDRFWSSRRRNALAVDLGLAHAPQLAAGRLTMAQVQRELNSQTSRFGEGAMEGVVVRSETTQWCEARAKLVRAEFAQSIDDHWRKRKLEWNRLALLPTQA